MCRAITRILKGHKTTVEELSMNYRNGVPKIDAAKKIEIITEIRAEVGGIVNLEELAAYINISPSSISYFTDKELITI